MRPLTMTEPPEAQPEVVQGIEVQREAGLDQGAALAEIEDRHRLVDRDFPGHLACEINPLRVARPSFVDN